MNKILVIGDLIVDHTIYVEPSKIAQEAPIIAYRELRDEFSHGGAGAVGSMISALGGDVYCVHFAGVRGFVASCKTRYVCAGSRNPTIVGRFDSDTFFEWQECHAAMLQSLLNRVNPRVVVISDYGKGVVNEGLVTLVREELPGVTIVVDPYTRDWSKYAGADIILPSRSAAADFLEDEDMRGFSAVIAKLDREGCRLYGAGPSQAFEATTRGVIDVTGAGDQFVATLAINLRPGVTLPRAIAIANFAAGMQVERMGVVPVTADELRTRWAQMGEMALATADA